MRRDATEGNHCLFQLSPFFSVLTTPLNKQSFFSGLGKIVSENFTRNPNFLFYNTIESLHNLTKFSKSFTCKNKMDAVKHSFCPKYSNVSTLEKIKLRSCFKCTTGLRNAKGCFGMTRMQTLIRLLIQERSIICR